jgi:predicted aldo/keto reductase-like oxidoreductase
MIYKVFKDIRLSRLGMGNMRLPATEEGFRAPVDYNKAQEIIDYAMANGINYYDTAFDYHGGDSEKFLGKALAKYKREDYYLATKFFILASPDYKAMFEEQLSRLKTDYIDFYLIHGIFDHTFQKYIDCGCIEYLLKQKEQGRIRYFGFSSHANTQNFKTFLNLRQWDFVQIQLNFFDWLYGDRKEQYEILENQGIPTMAMSPVRGGRLASLTPEAETMLKTAHPDWSIASWSFYWLKRLSGTQVILSGMSTLDQIKENVSLFANETSLNNEDEKTLFKACEAFRSKIQVPCTSCRYCCNNCPAQIDIVKILEIYNQYRIDGPWALTRLEHVESKGKPADCSGCGMCNERCPQSIDVKGIMNGIADLVRKMPKRA